jgi:hypothetical protein
MTAKDLSRQLNVHDGSLTVKIETISRDADGKLIHNILGEVGTVNRSGNTIYISTWLEDAEDRL